MVGKSVWCFAVLDGITIAFCRREKLFLIFVYFDFD